MANEKRLISAEQAYEVARLHHHDFAQSIADLTSLREVLEDCDTVDAVEVVHGRWEYHTNASVQCSACGGVVLMRFKFCPNCGAKMDGERKDNG